METMRELEGMSDHLSDDEESESVAEALHRFVGAVHDLVPSSKVKQIIKGLELCKKQVNTARTTEDHAAWAAELDKISKSI